MEVPYMLIAAGGLLLAIAGALLVGLGVVYGLGWPALLSGTLFLAGGAWLLRFARKRPWRRPDEAATRP